MSVWKKRAWTFVAVLASGLMLIHATAFKVVRSTTKVASDSQASEARAVYDKLRFPALSFQAFEQAFEGYTEITESTAENNRFLLIADFSLPSSEKRFFLLDFSDTSVLHQDFVAHGRNSGELFACTFSNTPESKMSSLGFFSVEECYYGEHGLSIRLDGLDKGYNDNARSRAIVMHTADYAHEGFIDQHGRLGRSHGCPVIPKEAFQKYAKHISGQSILFIYFPDQEYLEESVWLN